MFPRNLILISFLGGYVTFSVKIISMHKPQIKYILLLQIIYQTIAKFVLWKVEFILRFFLIDDRDNLLTSTETDNKLKVTHGQLGIMHVHG